MSERLAKEPDKVRQRLKARRQLEEQNATVSPSARLGGSSDPRTQKAAVLERAIGPVAYRGRTNYTRKKEPERSMMLLRERNPLQKRFIPRNTIRSERA